jgi:ribosomal protein S18 acetylase RimI-like enzyme
MADATEAVSGDVPELCTLLGELFQEEKEFRPDRKSQARALKMILQNPASGGIIILREEGGIVAAATVLFTISTALGDRAALLQDIVVAPYARGRGLGGRMLEAVKRYATSHGCRGIMLLTDFDNFAAQRFYARHGFAASGMRLMRFTA